MAYNKRNSNVPPIIKQYNELKQKHPDALLLFRCGDFYETYKDDAVKASNILGITLTRHSNRMDENGKPLNMAGFPYRALDTYLPKLIRAGERVAICDQLEGLKEKAVPQLGVRMQLVVPESSLTEKERHLMSQIVADLETGNSLLGHPRPEGYLEFAAEHNRAVRALKEGSALTARQRDILTERANQYHGGVAELAETLNISEQRLRQALFVDRLQDELLRDSLIEKLRNAGIDVNTDVEEGERILQQENERVKANHFAESKDEFDRIREIVANEKGVVMPGLANVEFAVVDTPLHDFDSKNRLDEALAWAKKNIVSSQQDVKEGNLPRMKDGTPYSISINAISKYLSGSAIRKSESLDVHLSILKNLLAVIGESIDTEIRPDYPKDEEGQRLPSSYNFNSLIHVLYGAALVGEDVYRVKTIMQEFRNSETNKPHSYEAIKIEFLDTPMAAGVVPSVNIGQQDADTKEATRNSILGAKLLKDIEKSKDFGKNLLEESGKSIGIENLLREPRVVSADMRYMLVPDSQSPIFISNARMALDKIKQEKATPEQWLNMIENLGGMKAGEDRWTGLSDWLRSSNDRVLTKQQVIDYINENQIQVEEVHYIKERNYGNSDELRALQKEYDDLKLASRRGELLAAADQKYEAFSTAMQEKYGDNWEERLTWHEKTERHSLLQQRDNCERAFGRSDAEIAYDVMVSRHGDDWGMAFYQIDGLLIIGDEDRARLLLGGGDREDFPIDITRLRYTTKGLDNNREIALVVPTIESWNWDDHIHFGEAGFGRAVAWVRFGETVQEGSDERVLVIDEIQSKRHQEGREQGYRRDIRAERDAVAKVWAASGRTDDSAFQKLQDLNDEIREREYFADDRPPAAPFEKNWQELAMKRMLRYAAENGYDRVAWTTGMQQIERYSLGGKADKISINHSTEHSENYCVTAYPSHGRKGTQVWLDATEKEVLQTFGKGIGEQLIKGCKEYDHQKALGEMPANRVFVLSGKDMDFGGEGMKAFYDHILPNFANKYCKQWGVAVEDVELPAIGESMHSIPVTAQMKQDVREDQPMFFRNGERQAYGFVHNGTIYIDPRIATAETPIHEYTHLWTEVLRQRNPQEWKNIVQMMKNTPEVWNYVRQNYPDLQDEDQIADEALAQFSGQRGTKQLQKLAAAQSNTVTVFDKMTAALEKFWKGVAEFFGIHYTSKEQVADRILYDLLNEVNPLDFKIANPQGLREQQESLIDSDNFKQWFGDWKADPINASKVIDEQGRPLVVEHATNADFTIFDINHLGKNSHDKGLFGAGFYFGTHAPGWLYGTQNVMQVYLDIKYPIEIGDLSLMDMYSEFKKKLDTPSLRGMNIMFTPDRHLTVGEYIDHIKAVDALIAENPALVREMMAKDEELEFIHPKERERVWREHEIINRTGFPLCMSWQSVITDQIGSEVFSAALKKDGYDGIIVDRAEGYKEYVAFDAAQIKSATDNIGLFNRNNPDIRYHFIDENTILAAPTEDVARKRRLSTYIEYPNYKDVIVHDDKGIGFVVEHNGTDIYLLNVPIHDFDIADDARKGIGGMELDADYDESLRFTTKEEAVDFYVAHQEDLDYRSARWRRINDMAVHLGRAAAEAYSRSVPVNDIFRPVPPLREWVDVRNDVTFQSLPVDARLALTYFDGMTFDRWRASNRLSNYDPATAYYFWQKYADRQDVVKKILQAGISRENVTAVAHQLAALADTRAEALNFRSLLAHYDHKTNVAYYEAVQEVFDIRQQELLSRHYPVLQSVQGLEDYSVEEIEQMVKDHVKDRLAEDFMTEDIYIKEISIIGSRCRGEARPDSDLDILLEYGGTDVREDTLYNVLHEEPLKIGGVKVDINPINEHYSLNTRDWLIRDARWREEDNNKKQEDKETSDRFQTRLENVRPEIFQKKNKEKSLIAAYSQLKKDSTMEEKKNEAVAQKQKVQQQQEEKKEKVDRFANLDYTAYSLPEGVTVDKANIFKLTQGENAGKYALFAVINSERMTRVMYKNDLDAYFDKNTETGKRRAELDQLVAKYFGKSAEKQSVDTENKAKKEEVQQKQAELQTAASVKETKEVQKQDAQEQKEDAKKEKKESIPSVLIQAELLAAALGAASAKDGVWLNKDGKQAPDFIQKGQVISPFNALMMSLHSDAHGYKTNQYLTFNAAKAAGVSVKKEEKGLPFNWYNWDKYVSRINSNDIIKKEQYDALPIEEKDIYKQMRSKEERKIFNLDQTTMSAVSKSQYKEILDRQDKSVLGRGVKETVEAPSEGKSLYDTFKEQNPDTLLVLRTGDDHFELHGADAEKAASILHIDLDRAEGKEAALVISDTQLDKLLPQLVRDGQRVSVQSNLDKPELLRRYDIADRIYAKVNTLVEGIGKCDADNLVVSGMKSTGYDVSKDILTVNDSRAATPGEEVSTAIRNANDVYRAVVAYTGAENRLNRGLKGKMLPDDAVKYDKLVQEVSAGVLMARQGLPATISKSNLPLVPYWERELKEDPKLVERLENDVNNALQTVSKLCKGEAVDYAVVRGEKNVEAMKPRFYTIASRLAALPDMEKKHIVVVKDTVNKSAAVILPSGASLEVNNEAPGLSKTRIATALKKEGYQADNIKFYNAGGSLGFHQSNEYFADKTIEVARLKQYDLNTISAVEVKDEIARTSKVDIEQVTMTRDTEGKYVLYVKPSEESAFTVYPEADDVRLFFDSVKSEKFDDVRGGLGQKYYAFVKNHPDFNKNVLMPAEPEGLDLSRITKVSIVKDKYKDQSYIMFATIDGESQKPREISGLQAKHMWLVDDKDIYKVRLAALLFEDKLGLSESQSETQFRDNNEGQGVDEGGEQESPEKEQQTSHRSFHR